MGDLVTELLLLVLSIGAGLVAVFVLMILGVLPDATSAGWSGIVSGPILIGAAGLSYLALDRFLSKRDPPLPRPTREPAGVGTGLAVALGGVILATVGTMILSFAQQKLLSIDVEEQQTIVELVRRGDPFELALLGVAAVVLAPLTEELLFRHMFFRRLLRAVGPAAAWTLPAVAFALAHWNPVGLAVYIWLGTVFALAYWYSGRLWVAVLVHAGHNALALFMLLKMVEA